MKKLALMDCVKPKVTLQIESQYLFIYIQIFFIHVCLSLKQDQRYFNPKSTVTYKVSWGFTGPMVPMDPKGPKIKQVK